MVIVRLLILAVMLAALGATGLLTFDLPWSDPGFQVSGATVLIYLSWSLAGARCACSGRSPARLALYAVLLVSAVDSFLLRLSSVEGLVPLRWVGAAILAAGCVLSLLNRRSAARFGSSLQCIGLALGLGSIAGTACAAFASVIILRAPEGPGADENP
jgi:hypothetical protein